MRTPVSVGYLRPRDDSIQVSSWLLVDEGGAPTELPSVFSDWDYQQDLHIVATLSTDAAAVREQSALSQTAPIRCHVQWHSTGTGLRGTSRPVDLKDGITSIDLRIQGHLLGGTLNLEARAVLGPLGPTMSPYAAKRIGSSLWSASYRTDLEGAASRFPVTQLSFADAGIAGGRGAAWCLHLESHDLIDSASRSLRMYLNTDHSRVREYLALPDQPVAAQFARNLRFGVQRQLVSIACEHEDLDLDGTYEGGSLGELLATLVKRLFPDRDLRALRSDLHNYPGDFEAELQARTGFEP